MPSDRFEVRRDPDDFHVWRVWDLQTHAFVTGGVTNYNQALEKLWIVKAQFRLMREM